MENDILSMTILIFIAGAILYGAYTLMKTRFEQILFRWADENGYQILDLQPKFIFQGPFNWSSKNQTIFRVAVEDAEGTQRTGWVRCGSYWGGIFSYKAELKWD